MTSISKTQIQDLDSEILLMLFHRLGSIEMVRSMRVCRRWYDLLHDHKSLWRQLILPYDKHEARVPSREIMALGTFDKRSGSSLTRISMKNAHQTDQTAASTMFAIVLKSKKSLQAMDVVKYDTCFERAMLSKLNESSKLVDCRFTSLFPAESPVLLRKSGLQEPSGIRRQEPDEISSFEVLWTRNLWKRSGNRLDHLVSLERLDHLVSLKVELGETQQHWRRILERPSQTLKHVDIVVIVGAEEERAQHEELPALYFPNLKIMEVLCESFPSWIKTPPSSTLIIDGFREASMILQSCSKLWIDLAMITDSYQWLVGSCPALSELRIKKAQLPAPFRLRELNTIVDIVRQRQRNVESGRQIEGVTMARLQTLVLPLSLVAEKLLPGFLSQLKEMVEEVMDMDGVSKYIELEI